MDHNYIFFKTYLLLLAGHALGDFALQNDFVAKNKDPNSGFDGWVHVLMAHSLIHGLIVYCITQSMILFILETLLHAFIDNLKCSKKISFVTDQHLHTWCKVVWAFIYVYTLNLSS